MPWNESTKMDEKLKFTWWHYKTKSIKLIKKNQARYVAYSLGDEHNLMESFFAYQT
jgi:hypothetical protein